MTTQTQQKKIKKHVSVSVKGLEARLMASNRNAKHGLWKILTDDTGRFLMWEEVRIELDKCIRKGYEVVPTCDNFDSKGHCKGHEVNE